MILMKNVKLIHKMLMTVKPKQVMKLPRKPRTQMEAKITKKYLPKNLNYLKNQINQAIIQYNELEEEMKKMSIKEFNAIIKKINQKPP